MSIFRFSVRRVGALVAFALAATLPGCATYSDSYYARDDRYGYARDDRYGGDYYYGRDDGYYNDPYWGAYAYDSIFWPTYRWYDPWYSPAYSYGVSFSPSWYGLSFGFGGHGFGYGSRYHHYAPYRASWWDNRAYYGGAGWRHGYRDVYSGRRFGSARNEAERIARAEGMVRPQREDTVGSRAYSPDTYRSGGDVGRGSRYRGIDYGDRGEPRGDQRVGDPAREAQRDAAWGGDTQRAYSRYRGPDEAPIRRGHDWRDAPRGEQAPREIDSRALGGYDDPRRYDRGSRMIDPSSDAHARARDASPRYEQPRYEQPRYQQPPSQGFQGGNSRPAAPSRSYDAPSMPSPRADSGRDSGGESRRSREPD